MDINEFSKFYLPSNIFVVKKLEKKITSIITSNKNYKINKILFVYDFAIKNQAKKIIKSLKRFDIQILEYKSNEPSADLINKEALRLKKKFNLVVGMGGGSTLDFSKCLSIKLKNKSNIWNYTNLSYKKPIPIKNKPVPLCLIASTAGTGSEITPYAVVRNLKIFEKGTINDQLIIPTFSIIYPELLKTVPKQVKTYNAIDAMAHSIEAFINISKKSHISDYFSILAFRLIFNNLNKSLKKNDYKSNLNICLASLFAGIAISHKGTTVAHAIAETIGGLTGLGHAHCVTVSTKEVLKFTRHNKKINNKLLELLENSKSKNFYNEFEKFLKKLKIEKLKIDENKFENFENVVLKKIFTTKFRPLKFHPKKLNQKDIKTIINNLIN